MNLPRFPTDPLSLHRVQVWVVFLPHVRNCLGALHGLLSPEESRRAARLVFEQDQERFILTHGILRILLGQYLNQEPASLGFRYGAHGKPGLNAAESSPESLCFNLSHSGDYCLCAFALSRQVGVDIEMVRSNVECLQLAERFFARREYEDLRKAAEEVRRALFYRYWTCKEAYLKARGLGLSSGLDRIEVTFAADGSVGCCDTGRGMDGQNARWVVKELSLGHEVAAAVAAAGDDWDVAVSHYAEPCG